MQRIILDIDDKYSDLIINFLSNLKSSVIKNIKVEQIDNKKAQNNLKKFRELRAKSNNKVVLTKHIAVNTDEMINDDLF